MTAPEEPAVPTCTAAGCGLPQAPGSQLCALDVRRLGDWLAQIDTEYDRLTATPSMQGREVGTIGGTTLAAQRSVGSMHVMALRDRRRGSGRIGADDADDWGLDDTPSVYETLASWAARVREGRELTPPRIDLAYRRAAAPPGPVCDPHAPRCGHHTCEVWTFRANVAAPLTVATERALLVERQNFRWLLLQDWAGEFFDEIRALWVLLRGANGHAPPRQVSRLSEPCTACGVRAVTHRPGQDLMQCQSCNAFSEYHPDGERMSCSRSSTTSASGTA